MRFAFGAGGTGGHIIPALALAKELKAAGHECFFIGNKDSMEERLSQNAGFGFRTIKVQKLYRKLSLSNLLFPYYLFKSVLDCQKLIRACQGVITTGGFVAGPVALAALRLRIPCFLHESNSYPGLTTRHLAKHLTRFYISFDETAKYLPKVKAINLGIPIIKREIVEFKLPDIGLQEAKDTLLISGGSQGSVALNKVISQAMPELLARGWQIIWQTGANSYQEYQALHKDTPGLYLFDFSPLLAEMMKAAKLAITRAGALTIAELEAAKLPAIHIPLPTAAANHQYYNALAQKQKGIATLIEQKDFSPQRLLNTLDSVANWLDTSKLNALGENTAARDIAQDILNTYQRR